MYRGKVSDNDFLPFYSAKATGDVLLAAAKKNPDIQFQLYCGHTHGQAFYQPLDNLVGKTGKAEYSAPEIQEVIEI